MTQKTKQRLTGREATVCRRPVFPGQQDEVYKLSRTYVPALIGGPFVADLDLATYPFLGW